MKPNLIFFGNGPLADYSKAILSQNFNILFHARTKEDLETVKALKTEHKDAFGVLASFGVMIKSDVLDLFEPLGILNIHPSLLPDLRGSSPIETAILRGDTSFSVSVMKLVKKMDAGPIYYQTTLDNLPLEKSTIYKSLSETAALWLAKNITNLPTPAPQDENSATFSAKFEKKDGILSPKTKSASVLLREVIAFSGFPKSKYPLFGHDCTILAAHTSDSAHIATSTSTPLTEPLNASKDDSSVYFSKKSLALLCADGDSLYLDRIQPAGKNPMDARSFLNGYAK